MEAQRDFKELLALFNAHNVEYAIVGAYAVRSRIARERLAESSAGFLFFLAQARAKPGQEGRDRGSGDNGDTRVQAEG